MHLRQGFAVGLDVVGAPQHDRDGLGPGAALLLALHLQQALHHDARALHGRLRGDALRVQRVDVLPCGQHARVADGVPAGAGLHVAALQRCACGI